MVPIEQVRSAEYRQMHSVFALLRTTVPQRILVAADTPRTAMLGVQCFWPDCRSRGLGQARTRAEAGASGRGV